MVAVAVVSKWATCNMCECYADSSVGRIGRRGLSDNPEVRMRLEDTDATRYSPLDKKTSKGKEGQEGSRKRHELNDTKRGRWRSEERTGMVGKNDVRTSANWLQLS